MADRIVEILSRMITEDPNITKHTEDEWDRQGFKTWMEEIDDQLMMHLGFSHRRLTDQPWAEWYAEGFTVDEAVQEVLSSYS